MKRCLVLAFLPVAMLLMPASPASGALQGPAGQIAFSSSRDGNREIYIMDSGGANQTRLTNDPGLDDEPTLNSTGDLLLWRTDRTGNDEVFQDVLPRGSIDDVTNNPSSDSQPTFTVPWSDRFFFVSSRTGNDEIYVQDRNNGTGLANLTNNPAADTAPNTNGQKVAFVSDRDGNKEIYVMNPDGSGLTRLTNNPADDQAPGLAPDGHSIAFESNRSGNFEVYTMNLDGTALTNVSNSPASDREPAWSPDSSQPKIAFQSNRDGNFEIYSMNADGSGQMRLTNSPGADVNPDWGPSTLQGYPRPKGASPLRASLVPAYQPCTTPNRTHGAPLAFGSCTPPAQRSSFLTIGSPDSNGAPAGSVGSVLLDVKVTYPHDMSITASITDVRCLPSTSPSVCGDANATDGPDYSGQVQVRLTVRRTDRQDGSMYPSSSTLVDLPFPFNVSCSSTSPFTGAACGISTTANAISPGVVPTGWRSTWQLGPVEAYDAGADGVVSTTGDETLFMTQGIFVP